MWLFPCTWKKKKQPLNQIYKDMTYEEIFIFWITAGKLTQSFISRKSFSLFQSHDERVSDKNVILIHIWEDKKRKVRKHVGWKLSEVMGHLFKRKVLLS